MDRSVFELLTSLKKLFLSYNLINSINEGDLNGLLSLQELNLDHNRIIKISSKSFEEVKNLKKLFLNNNLLYYLPKGVFDNLNISNLIAVDISEVFLFIYNSTSTDYLEYKTDMTDDSLKKF